MNSLEYDKYACLSYTILMRTWNHNSHFSSYCNKNLNLNPLVLNETNIKRKNIFSRGKLTRIKYIEKNLNIFYSNFEFQKMNSSLVKLISSIFGIFGKSLCFSFCLKFLNIEIFFLILEKKVFIPKTTEAHWEFPECRNNSKSCTPCIMFDAIIKLDVSQLRNIYVHLRHNSITL